MGNATGRPWMWLVGAIALIALYAILRSGGNESTGPPLRPAAVDDRLNRGIFLDGGQVPRRGRRAGDTVSRGPRSTVDEGSGWIVGGFWMQEHEVTNEEYRRFVHGHAFEEGEERLPVVNLTWEDAMAYAEWLGGTLPTEAEWQFAASGLEGREYPWGNEEPTCERAYYAECGPRGPIPVMSLPAGATPDGIHDLAGNVWEWVTATWFVPGRTPVNSEARRMRGGSFDDTPFYLRVWNRSNDFPDGHRYISSGFRVVWPVWREY